MPDLYEADGERNCRPFPRAPFSAFPQLAYASLRAFPNTPLDEAEHFTQNQKASVARSDSVRLQPGMLFGFLRNTCSVSPESAAAITIVEFADFQCPYCKQTEATLNDLLRKYPGQVRLAFRDFPLGSIHPYAEKAAEAARCAGKEGKFWEYHDALFANQSKLDEPGLNAIAQRLALDQNSFQSCLASGEYKAGVSLDQGDGRKAGISSTPGFFINGIAVTGAQPETAFENIIGEELKAARNQPVMRVSR